MGFHPSQNVFRVRVKAHPPGHLFNLGSRNPIHLGDLPHRCPSSKAHVIGHRRHALRAINLPQFLMEGIALVPGKIHIDVRRVLPLRVEETAKKEVVADGVHVRDAQEITHQAGGGAAAAAMNGTPPHHVGHHQEIVHVAFGVNQFQLLRKALFNGGIAFTVTPANSLPAFLHKERKVIVRLIFIVGEDSAEMVPGGVATPGQLHRIGQGFGTIGEVPGHLLRSF